MHFLGFSQDWDFESRNFPPNPPPNSVGKKMRLPGSQFDFTPWSPLKIGPVQGNDHMPTIHFSGANSEKTSGVYATIFRKHPGAVRTSVAAATTWQVPSCSN